MNELAAQLDNNLIEKPPIPVSRVEPTIRCLKSETADLQVGSRVALDVNVDHLPGQPLMYKFFSWILIANAWMQHPVGYTIRNGRAELTDFMAVVTQKGAVVEFAHTVGGAYILGGFFVMGVSAYHLLRKQHVSFFTKSFRIALTFSLIFSIFEVVQGHFNGSLVVQQQPTKLAAMESLWETKAAAPMYLVVWPDEKNERNLIEFGGIPGGLSFIAYNDFSAVIKGLKDFPKDERPPVTIVAASFRTMVALGGLFVLLTLWGWIRRNRLRLSCGWRRLT